MPGVQSKQSPTAQKAVHATKPKVGKADAKPTPRCQALGRDNLKLSAGPLDLYPASVLDSVALGQPDTPVTPAKSASVPLPQVAGPDSPIAPFKPKPEPIGPGGSLDVEQSTEGTTVALQQSKFKLTYRDIENSPTMMNGAQLFKLDYALSPQTTAFVGAGQLPNFFHQTVGPDTMAKSPMTVAYAGIEDFRHKDFNLGDDFKLNLDLHSLAIATGAYDHSSKSFDASTSAGLSKGVVTGDVSVSRQFGNVKATVGYGNSLDLGMIGTYYASGGSGLFPLTHYVDASVKGKAGPINYEVDGYVPLHTASNDFSAVPLAQATLSAPTVPWLPNISLEAATDGTNSIQLSKSWALSKHILASASVEGDNLLGSGSAAAPEFEPMPGLSASPSIEASVGLKFTWGGAGKGSPSAVQPDADWRQPQSPPIYKGPKAPQKNYCLADFFTKAQIQQMVTAWQAGKKNGDAVAVLSKYLKTPEEVAAFLYDGVQYDYSRETLSTLDIALSPEQVAELLKGICRDQHAFAVDLMKDAAGINGQQIGYLSPETPHAIAVYQDPGTGKWNVMEYGTIHYTEAASAHAAFEEVRPDALVYGDWSKPTDNSAGNQIDINYTPTTKEFDQFVTPSMETP